MKETAVRLGSEKSLVGVVTDPGEGVTASAGCVLLNAGFTHRVGPQGLYVKVARRLAEHGIASLRLDFSGLGDSAPRRDGMAFEDSTLAEASQAIDFLQATRGVSGCLLVGVCWGADNALRVASADQRVIGVGAIDFYALMSLRSLLRSYVNRLVDVRSWGNLLSGNSTFFARVGHGVGQTVRGWLRPRPAVSHQDGLMPVKPPQRVLDELGVLVERGTDLWFGYAGGGFSYDQYRRNLRRGMETLAATGRLHVEVFPAADHVFTLLRNQAALVDAVARWADGVTHGQVAAPEPRGPRVASRARA